MDPGRPTRICHRRLQYLALWCAYSLVGGLIEYGKIMPGGHLGDDQNLMVRPVWWRDYARQGLFILEISRDGTSGGSPQS